MFLGRFQLGDAIPLTLRTVNGSGVAAAPAQAPAVHVVYQDGTQKAGLRLPVADRYGVTGLFAATLLLDHRFSTGMYTVSYQYVISGTGYGELDQFEVVAGGAAEGSGLAAFYFSRPSSDAILVHTDSGRLIRRRNPRIV